MRTRFGDQVKANTEAIVGEAFGREVLRVSPSRSRPGLRHDGEPDLVELGNPPIGIEVSAAIGDGDYPARLSAWLRTNPQAVPVHSTSASSNMPIPLPMSSRRAEVADEASRVIRKHMAQPYASWSYFVINLSQDPVVTADAEWIAHHVEVPDDCPFLGTYLCYITDRQFLRRFLEVRRR